MPAATRMFLVLEKREHAPQSPQEKHKRDYTERILIRCHAGIHLVSAGIITAAHVRKVLDENDGKGEQDEAKAGKQAFERRDWLRVRCHNENHHQVADGLSPTLERYIRVS